MAALVGIPWLATFVGAGLASIVEFFARVMTRKIAVIVTAIAAATALVAAFVATMYGFATALSASIPSDFLAVGGLLLPSNVDDVVATLVAARFAKWIYRWNLRAIDWKLKASV